MAPIRPVSWIYVEELNITVRWVQGDLFQDVMRGNWSHNRELPILERIATNKTWVDNADIYREANRYLKARHEKWYARNGALHSPPLTSQERMIPSARPPDEASRQSHGYAGTSERSTDFVRR